jgi:ArsR family transcriptional regulator
LASVELSIDDVLVVLENPIRRRILERLTKETHYPLQLSKELNVTQQAIMKHLKVLEDYGLVKSFEERSTSGGPPRKCYLPIKKLSLRIDIGPNTFEATLKNLEEKPQKAEVMTDHFNDLEEDYRAITESEIDTHERLAKLTKLIEKVNMEIRDIESQRMYLTQIRENMLREVYGIVAQISPIYDERKVLYYIINEHDMSLPKLSEALDIREKVLRDLMKHMARERLLFGFDDDE